MEVVEEEERQTSSPTARAPGKRLADFLATVSAAADVGAVLDLGAQAALDAFAADHAIVTATPDGSAPPCYRAESTIVVDLDGEGRGQLRVTRLAPAFDDDDRELLRAMGRVLAMTVNLLENRDKEHALLRSLRERQDLLDRLARIQRSIYQRAPLAEVLDTICLAAAELLGDDVAGLRLLDESDPGMLVMVASVGVRPVDTDQRNWSTPVGVGAGGRAVAERRLVVVEEYAAASCRLPVFVHSGVEAAMASPVFESGRVVGSLTVASRRPGRRYSEAEQDVLRTFAEHASLALNDARTADALRRTLGEPEFNAHDGLTGLATRAGVLDHLGLALGVGGPAGLAVLYVDLDRFKMVNDSLGHDLGDAVLREVARRIRRCARPGDLVGRVAGDEFVVVGAGLNGEIDALGLADRICRDIAAPMSIGGRELVVTASVGVTRAGPASSADQLVRDADVAMFRAKERGRDRIELYGKDLRDRLLVRVETESDLRRAIHSGEFLLHYQPTVDLGTGRPLLVEALLRWKHPVRGMVPPGEFIAVAEDTNLIVPIGTWALRQACSDLASWRRSVPALADMQVSVNLSACQFGDEDVVRVVADALADSGLEPSALWLEITETVLMDEADTTTQKLRSLKALGVQLSIDDFGTGYSSLTYLKRFPVDVLKIDRSFVAGFGVDPEDEAIVTAVVTLAHVLGKSVVAEGIEHDRQLSGLRALGCNAGQGFLFSPGLSAAQVVPWLEARLSV